MSEHQGDQEKPAPGFCSATCVEKACLQREIQKPEPKTSDYFATCNLPKRFEHPRAGGVASDIIRRQSGANLANFFLKNCKTKVLNILKIGKPVGNVFYGRSTTDWFNGYGSQVSKQHPFYRTSASEYGWYAPGIHSVPSVYHPKSQSFTNYLLQFGMYRNYSLNTGRDPQHY